MKFHTDYKVNINTYIKDKWQTLWDTFPDNKLHSFQALIDSPNSNMLEKRRDDIVLTRARIGHTYLTHAYLLRSEPIPECIPCNCFLTVKHVLIECGEYENVRQKYFDVPDLKTLFRSVNPTNIINYLKEIELYKLF